MIENIMEGLKILLALFLLLGKVRISTGLDWGQVQCSTDALAVADGPATDMSRFPWLGVIQHSFEISGQTQYAVTSAVLVHPAYAIAPAEDIAKIPNEQVANGTKLILWRSNTQKYAIEVNDYILHPEYTEGRTRATIALLELEPRGETGVAGENSDTVLPICLPIKGAGSFSDIYVAKMREGDNLELQKEVFEMSFIDNQDCENFYFSNELNSKLMAPSLPTCAKVKRDTAPCVWDGGAALITRQAWGHWLLLGFGVRGAGCGAPARFVNMHDYMPWINDMLSTSDDDPEGETWHRFGIRRLSPTKIKIYPLDQIMPWGWGQCEKGERGSVLYKDAMEITSSKNTGQGFYFASVSQIATFSCASVNMEEVTAKSNSVIWIEHDCHREQIGLASGNKKPRDDWKDQCFMYFQSTAFIEFRFYFSFRAVVEMTLYGSAEPTSGVSLPPYLNRQETTDEWWPTERHLKWYTWASRHKWFWHM